MLYFSRYSVTDTSPVSFLWVFHKQSMKKELSYPTFELVTDVAKIYTINITNTMGGAADSCQSCPKGAANDG